MRRFILFMALIACTVSCTQLRPILDDLSIWVKFSIDWSKVGIKPYGMTIYIYPEADNAAPIVFKTHSSEDSIRLPRGKYSFVVINETETTHEFINFRGTDQYSTSEAFAKPIKTADNLTDIVNPASSPNLLAADNLSGFEITREMIHLQQKQIVKLVPKRVTPMLSIRVHINGIDNLARTGSYGSLDGMAEGQLIISQTPTQNTVTHLYMVNSRTFDPGSFTTGTISAKFYIFGHYSSKTDESPVSNIIRLYFKLRNGKMHPVMERDVTGLIRRSRSNDEITFEIELGLGLPGDPQIVLPEVPAEDDSGSGFDVDVKDWGENIEIEIPV